MPKQHSNAHPCTQLCNIFIIFDAIVLHLSISFYVIHIDLWDFVIKTIKYKFCTLASFSDFQILKFVLIHLIVDWFSMLLTTL